MLLKTRRCCDKSPHLRCKKWNTDDADLADDASTGSAQIFFLLCSKIRITSAIQYPAKQDNPVNPSNPRHQRSNFAHICQNCTIFQMA